MKYQLIGFRPNHREMKEMVGKTLLSYCVTAIEPERVNIKIIKNTVTGLGIGENGKWEFIIDNQNLFNPDEPLFTNEKSLKRYVKQVWSGRVLYKEMEIWN